MRGEMAGRVVGKGRVADRPSGGMAPRTWFLEEMLVRRGQSTVEQTNIRHRQSFLGSLFVWTSRC
jgi:hypothetical protein